MKDGGILCRGLWTSLLLLELSSFECVGVVWLDSYGSRAQLDLAFDKVKPKNVVKN